MTTKPGHHVNLVYSYSHKDAQYKKSMEAALAQLRREGLLNDWSDRNILPGQSISAEFEARLKIANVAIFLFSQDFIASEACMSEWRDAKDMASEREVFFRIPVIISECAWLDVLGDDDIKALPDDGVPVKAFERPEVAWHQVYLGIKSVIEDLNSTFTPKAEFIDYLSKTEFLTGEHIKLQDIFVFPDLIAPNPQRGSQDRVADVLATEDDLLNRGHVLIHGQDRSGKTALARHTFLSLVKESQPVLYVDLNHLPDGSFDNLIRAIYSNQFHGAYALWSEQPNKTLVADNLSHHPRFVAFLVEALEHFERIIVTTSSDSYHAYFRDDDRLADLEELRINPLTHVQQEQLIRKRLALSNRDQPFTDGEIDQIENRVNTIIIDSRIVPRYAFFVLCILQTYEAYMPSNMAITSYGHCYQALIVASVVRAGISNADSDINACYNFCEQLAVARFVHERENPGNPFDFKSFVDVYEKEYIIPKAVVNRLQDKEYGLVSEEGEFRTQYMYYFFLGKHLAGNIDERRSLIDDMCDAIHLPANHLTLLFAIHHSTDAAITQAILDRTISALEDIPPARLDRSETAGFGQIIASLPADILSENDVESQREDERKRRDMRSVIEADNEDAAIENAEEIVGDIYRILKSNEVIGQVLRNHYGSLPKIRIEEIIEIVSNAGLRIVNLVLQSEEDMGEMARFLHARHPEHDIGVIRQQLSRMSFVWTMINVEHVVSNMNFPEIRPAISTIVSKRATPAFELVGYFASLDSAKQLTEPLKDELERLLKQYDDMFIKSVLSIRTQHYMNTHRSPEPIEQAVCSLLGIRHRQRMLQGR